MFEMASLDGLLPERFTAGIMSEVVELNIAPDRLMEIIWLKSTSFGLVSGECLVIQDLFVRRERGVKKRLHFGVGFGILGLHFGCVRGGVFHSLRGRLRRGKSESHPLAELFACTRRGGFASKPSLINQLGSLQVHPLGIDAEELADPCRFATTLIPLVLGGALRQHGGEQQAKKRGGSDDASPTLDDQFEEAAGNFDEFIARVRMELVEHGEGTMLEPLMDGHLVEMFCKPDFGISNRQQVNGF